MGGQVVGYVRVSSAEQNPDRQLEALGDCTKVFTDKISGKSRAQRTGLAALMDYIREDNTVRVAPMDWLGRSARSRRKELRSDASRRMHRRGPEWTLPGNPTCQEHPK